MRPSSWRTVSHRCGAGKRHSPDQREIKSDNLGNYEFLHNSEGNYVMTVSAEGYGQATIQNLSIAGPDDIERNVELEPALFLGGRITDPNGNGISEGATINAYLIEPIAATALAPVAKSGDDGAFEFTERGSGHLHPARGGQRASRRQHPAPARRPERWTWKSNSSPCPPSPVRSSMARATP